MADQSLGTSLGDFLVDFIGGDSNVKMKGLAAAQGFNTADTKGLLEQIAAAVKKSKDEGPRDVANLENPTLGDTQKVLLHHKNHMDLLNTLNDFYTKKYAPAPSAK